MNMKLSFPLFALFGLTRGLGGIGAGLLLADHISATRRRHIGKILFGIAAASTVPLLAAVVRRQRRPESGAGARSMDDTAGVMDAQSEIYQPSYGTIVDAEIEVAEVDQAEHPELPRRWP